MEDPTRDMIELPEPHHWFVNDFLPRPPIAFATKQEARDYANKCNCMTLHHAAFTADQMREMRRLAFEAGRARGLEEAAEACADVEERPWYGYENPNTFDDGKRKCAEAIRGLSHHQP